MRALTPLAIVGEILPSPTESATPVPGLAILCRLIRID